MAELVDARDSKSRFLGSIGSIPIAGTFLQKLIDKGLEDFFLLGNCFWRKGRGNPGLAEYMGEKGG